MSPVVCSKGRGAAVFWAQSLCALVVLGGVVSGCASFRKGDAKNKNARAELVTKDTTIDVEGCETNAQGAESLDANGDGKPEIVRVVRKGREECRTADLNFDGRVDRTTYFDDRGGIRRVESDFDRDGVVDEVALFESGHPTETRRATTLDGKIDTWDYFKGGRLSRTERDRNGDGVIDQWWEYPKEGCPLIHIDRDGDGRPDLGASVDYCKTTGESTLPRVSPPAAVPPPAEAVSSSEEPEQGPEPKDEQGPEAKAEKGPEAESKGAAQTLGGPPKSGKPVQEPEGNR